MTTTTELDIPTLNDVAEKWKYTTRSWTTDACVPTVQILPPAEDPEAHPVVLLGDLPVPLDEHGVDQLLNFYQIPLAFFHRLTREEQDFILNSRIDYAEGEITLNYTGRGIVEALKPTQPRLHPMNFIEAALDLVNGSAQVPEHWSTTADLRLDILNPLATAPAPDGGLLTAGVRFGQNRKANLAPWAAPIVQHSSGAVFQIPDPALKIEARRKPVEVIASLLAADGKRAMARSENDLATIYDLRNQSIASNRITILNRIGEEQNIPARPLAEVTTRLARIEHPTMYDLSLAIATSANSDALVGESGRSMRTRLQGISGRLVAEHAQRCGNCHARVA